VRERESMIARIRQLRRLAGGEHEPSAPQADGGDGTATGATDARIAHLEALVEGLQDSVHREFERHSGLIAELDTRLEPAALRVAMSEDARHRGL
jgi:hypothetical protein